MRRIIVAALMAAGMVLGSTGAALASTAPHHSGGTCAAASGGTCSVHSHP